MTANARTRAARLVRLEAADEVPLGVRDGARSSAPPPGRGSRRGASMPAATAARATSIGCVFVTATIRSAIGSWPFASATSRRRVSRRSWRRRSSSMSVTDLSCRTARVPDARNAGSARAYPDRASSRFDGGDSAANDVHGDAIGRPEARPGARRATVSHCSAGSQTARFFTRVERCGQLGGSNGYDVFTRSRPAAGRNGLYRPSSRAYRCDVKKIPTASVTGADGGSQRRSSRSCGGGSSGCRGRSRCRRDAARGCRS